LQLRKNTAMKSRQFFLSVIFALLVCVQPNFAQKLSSVKGEKKPVNRSSLTYESNKGDSILYLKGYSVIYSYALGLPRYVFHRLTVDQLITNESRPAVKRSNSFYPYKLPNGQLSATNRDYLKSGYDRGHMVPAGDFVWNKELKNETFYYININPQTPWLNRGIWANMEKRIRDRALSYQEDAYVVTGVVFNTKSGDQIGPRKIQVPVAFFKIVYFNKRNKMFAFLFDNTVESFEGRLSDFQVSVDMLEKITGEDFYDLLENNVEAILEASIENFDDK